MGKMDINIETWKYVFQHMGKIRAQYVCMYIYNIIGIGIFTFFEDSDGN
jgi:hypothetical protein